MNMNYIDLETLNRNSGTFEDDETFETLDDIETYGEVIDEVEGTTYYKCDYFGDDTLFAFVADKADWGFIDENEMLTMMAE